MRADLTTQAYWNPPKPIVKVIELRPDATWQASGSAQMDLHYIKHNVYIDAQGVKVRIPGDGARYEVDLAEAHFM